MASIRLREIGYTELKEANYELISLIKTMLLKEDVVIINLKEVKNITSFFLIQLFDALLETFDEEFIFNKIKITASSYKNKYIIYSFMQCNFPNYNSILFKI